MAEPRFKAMDWTGSLHDFLRGDALPGLRTVVEPEHSPFAVLAALNRLAEEVEELRARLDQREGLELEQRERT